MENPFGCSPCTTVSGWESECGQLTVHWRSVFGAALVVSQYKIGVPTHLFHECSRTGFYVGVQKRVYCLRVTCPIHSCEMLLQNYVRVLPKTHQSFFTPARETIRLSTLLDYCRDC